MKQFFKYYFNVKTGVYSQEKLDNNIRSLKLQLRHGHLRIFEKKEEVDKNILYTTEFYIYHLKLSALYSEHESSKNEDHWKYFADAYVFARDFHKYMKESAVQGILSLETGLHFSNWQISNNKKEICYRADPEQTILYDSNNQQNFKSLPEIDMTRNQLN